MLAERLGPELRNLGPDFPVIPFRVLELFEWGVMSDLLGELRQMGCIESCIWLHDGIWVFPPPTQDVFRQVEAKVYRKWDIHTALPALRCRDLSLAREEVISGLPHPLHARAVPGDRPTPHLAPLLPFEWHQVSIPRRLPSVDDRILFQYLSKQDNQCK